MTSDTKAAIEKLRDRNYEYPTVMVNGLSVDAAKAMRQMYADHESLNARITALETSSSTVAKDNRLFALQEQVVELIRQCDEANERAEEAQGKLSQLQRQQSEWVSVNPATMQPMADVVAERDSLKSKSLTCCFCGRPCDSLGSLKEHSATCESHPQCKERDSLTARVKELEGANEILQKLLDSKQQAVSHDVGCENIAMKERLRSAARTLIDAVGADGPQNAEVAAENAVATIQRLTAKVDELEADNERLVMKAANAAVRVRELEGERERVVGSVSQLDARKNAEIKSLTAERDALKAENERLKQQNMETIERCITPRDDGRKAYNSVAEMLADVTRRAGEELEKECEAKDAEIARLNNGTDLNVQSLIDWWNSTERPDPALAFSSGLYRQIADLMLLAGSKASPQTPESEPGGNSAAGIRAGDGRRQRVATT